MKHKKLVLATSLLLAFLLVYPVVATIGISPGSTTSIMGFPVTQQFTGLTASTSYTIWSTTDGNASQSVFTSDSDGEASVTLSPPDTGVNTYELRLTAGSNVLATWSVENTDVMLYLVPMITLMVLVGIVGAVIKMVQF